MRWFLLADTLMLSTYISQSIDFYKVSIPGLSINTDNYLIKNKSSILQFITLEKKLSGPFLDELFRFM